MKVKKSQKSKPREKPLIIKGDFNDVLKASAKKSSEIKKK